MASTGTFRLSSAAPRVERDMRVLVTGDRNWTDWDTIRCELAKLPSGPDTVLIHGDADGADTIADTIGREMGFTVLPFPANWNRYKRGAGPRRNSQMLGQGKPDMVLAFHPDLSKSKGTRDMVQKAEARGKEVRKFTPRPGSYTGVRVRSNRERPPVPEVDE